jgi:molybdopterin molybdotransferase
LISIKGARPRILAGLKPTPAGIVPLAEAWSLASPVLVWLTQRPADVSAMDGYALRATDGTEGAVLGVIGSAHAGRPLRGRIGPGKAIRIFPAASSPKAPDAILLQTDVASDGDRVTVSPPCALADIGSFALEPSSWF